MRSTFGSFNIVTSGLFASQRALDVTSHNISNANTEGFSRQKLLQRAALPMVAINTGVLGTGVDTYDVTRIRSHYLDYKYWGQNKIYSEWKVKADNLEAMESIFNEPSNTGLRKVMDELFNSIEELSKKPADATSRVAMLERAITFATTINRNGQELAKSIRDVNFAVKSKVDEVNSYTLQIANLNKQIFNFELDGHKANDLRDQRNLLVDKLSSIVNVNVNEYTGANKNTYFSVSIGGINIVDHFNRKTLTTVEEDINTPDYDGISQLGGGKISKVIWEGSQSQEVKIDSGELKGYLDIRDGDGSGNSYRGIPYYLKMLNTFSRELAAKFNEQHKMGMDAFGNAGLAIFSEPNGAELVNCINLKVNPAITSNPLLIAASSSINGESNNENLKKLVELRRSLDIFSGMKTTPDDFFKSMLSALAVDSKQAQRMTSNAEAIVEQTRNKRYSDSGVSLDEEMSNMVKFQHAYNASARAITTLDKIMDTTINRLGLVGR